MIADFSSFDRATAAPLRLSFNL